MNPFQSHLTPHGFMAEMLAAIGQKAFPLPEDLETAAIAFLQRLTALGYAEFAIDEGELEMQHGYGESPVIIKNNPIIYVDNKALIKLLFVTIMAYWISCGSSENKKGNSPERKI
jgi:hypothetical protein